MAAQGPHPPTIPPDEITSNTGSTLVETCQVLRKNLKNKLDSLSQLQALIDDYHYEHSSEESHASLLYIVPSL